MTPYSAAAGGSFSSRAELALDRLARVLGQRRRSSRSRSSVELGLLLVALAELLLDRLQLLAQEVLALALLDLGLHLRLDLRAELDHLELAAEDPRARSRSRSPTSACSSSALLLLGLDAAASRRRGGRARSGRRRSRPRAASSSGRYGTSAITRPNSVLDVAGQRLDLGRLLDAVGHLARTRRRGTGSSWTRALEPDAADALDEDPQRPVGDADHLVDDGGGADLVEVVPARRARPRRSRA